jgi:hypothetical protein
MMENKKDKLDVLLDFMMPLVKENLGGSHAKYLKDALMDYKGFADLLGSRWQTDHLTALEDCVINYKIVQIICSYYTLDVDFAKEVYWKSCYNRDFKEPVTNHQGKNQELNDVIAKCMNALDEYSATLLTLRNTHRASDAETAHISKSCLIRQEKKRIRLFLLFLLKN